MNEQTKPTDEQRIRQLEHDVSNIDGDFESIREVLKDYTKGYLYIITAISFGIIVWLFFQYKIDPFKSLFPILSTLFYSGGTLGFLQRLAIQSPAGTRPSEKLAKSLLIGSYVLGTIFSVLASLK